jgi:hypothetical protein
MGSARNLGKLKNKIPRAAPADFVDLTRVYIRLGSEVLKRTPYGCILKPVNTLDITNWE